MFHGQKNDFLKNQDCVSSNVAAIYSLGETPVYFLNNRAK